MRLDHSRLRPRVGGEDFDQAVEGGAVGDPGLGVDLVTYYDQVIRVDFAINRYGEYGVFFHLETPFYRW